MAVFRAFKPEAMNKIAKAMGYTGDMGQFQSFIEQDPMRQQQMQRYTNAAMQMAKGGVVKMQQGGIPAITTFNVNPGTREMRERGVDPFSFNLPGNPRIPGGFNLDALRKSGLAGVDDFGTMQQGGTRFARPNVMQRPANNRAPTSGTFNVAASNVAPMQSILPPNADMSQYRDNRLVPNDLRYVTGNFDPQFGSNPALRQAYVPTQGFTKVTKPKMDTNEFLADGETPNPNYMKPITDPDGNVVTEEVAPTIADISAQMLQTPGLPTGATVTAQGTTIDPRQEIDTTSGQVFGGIAVPTSQAKTTFAQGPIESRTNVMQAAQAAPAVDTALQATQAAQGTVSPEAQVLAAQQTASSVGDVNAAQGNAILMDNPVQREIQQGELISGVADAQTAAQFTEQVQAAEATPSKQATVQGQLDGLMQQFEGGETPVWAAGAMRAATQAMAARGLGASSIAGQAIVQAAMESALPVAQADAGIFAQFEQQNLSNRQQRTMLAAQQRAQFIGQEFDQAFQARVANAARIGDIANMNFTADQQIALENSRIANSMNLANLNNSQAVVMAEAAALSNLDMANLSNRQQSAVMNAQNFMQMDMANLSNQQQTDIFKTQQRIQSLFTDQAAENAARQFNASSQNQVDQFFANLANNVSQYNATQANAQAQFNAGQRNVVERFNAELNNQRDQFNASNRLVIDQSNAQWRRQVATADTAAINRANELNANALLGISNQAYNNMWQYYGDSMEWAWTSAENERSRVVNLAIEQLRADSKADIQNMINDYNSSVGFGNLIGTFLTASSSSVVGSLFGL